MYNSKQIRTNVGNYKLFTNSPLGSIISKVFRGQNMNNHQKLAIKMIPKSFLRKYCSCFDSSNLQFITQEVIHNSRIKHPNVVSYKMAIESSNNIYIIYQLCEKNLRQVINEIKNNGIRMSQKEAIGIIKQIRNGLQHLLEYGIIHTQLRPQKIMIKGNEYKIRDFCGHHQIELCKYINNNYATQLNPQTIQNKHNKENKHVLWSKLSYYSPPFVEYATQKFDIYSVGIIFYQLLMGHLPFRTDKYKYYQDNVKNGQPFYNIRSDLSPQVKDFLQKSIAVSQKRMNFTQFYNHPIFQEKNYLKPNQQLNKERILMENLRFLIKQKRLNLDYQLNHLNLKQQKKLNFQQFGKFLSLIDKNITIQLHRFMFDKIDSNKNGTIEFYELKKYLEKFDITFEQKYKPLYGYEAVQNLQEQSFQRISHENEQKIRNCFRKIRENLKKHDKSLQQLFKSVDKDRNHHLSYSEFRSCLLNIDSTLPQKDISRVFNMIDSNRSGQINYQQFQYYYDRQLRINAWYF